MKMYLGIDLSAYEGADEVNLNDIEQFEILANKIRLQIIKKHIANGVVFLSLGNIFIDDTVEIGKGTIVNSDNHLRGNTKIGKNCLLESGNIFENAVIANDVTVIKSVLKNCTIGAKTTVGPFAHIHTNSVVAKECRIGNFVEIKNSTIGINTKMAHLAYIGDVDIGNQCNIGCGSIFVNYDGKNKHRSSVGDSVFIGSNSNVIAPVRIEDNAYIAAGTTVTVDLPKNCMCIGRERETIKADRSKYKKNIFSKKYFGTDGIRGIYGETLTDEIAFLCGNFLGYSSDGGTIVIGRDNRESGENLSRALTNGITAAGANVVDLGIVSTPCVAFVTTDIKANYGIVISASHNPYQYNGIKVFNFDGRKLTDIEEVEIEAHIDNKQTITAEHTGKLFDGAKQVKIYIDDLCKMIGDLKGLKVVLDCSNGAVAKYAPAIFEQLGADVVSFNTSADGKKINDGCGALYPEFCAKKVLENKADVGFSYDGDADRLIAVNGKGEVVNGDSIIYMIGKRLKEENKLNGDAVVGTLYTNLGVEQSLEKLGIKLLRTDVGDHYVVERMMRGDYLVGGEQSGHIILREFSNTGDGILASLYLCKLMKETKRNLAELDDSVHFPQKSINIITKRKAEIMNDTDLKKYVVSIENELGSRGRILMRASGTEPKIRIMVECYDKDIAEEKAKKIESYVLEHFEI
ncbi:MAG: phosphoglucosamine mutase [Clostridia bacterium]